MNNLLKLQISSFIRNHKFKNFIFIIFISLLFIMILNSIYGYYSNKIDSIINDESNKLVYIYDYIEVSNINVSYNTIYYDLILADELKNNIYNFISDEFNEETYSIKINPNCKYKIDSNDINILYDDYISENNIYLNQSLSKYIYENYYDKCLNATIYITLDNYKDKTIIKGYLDSINVDYNINTTENNLNTYNNNILIIKIMIIFAYIIYFIIINYLLLILLLEEKKNVNIYNLVGINKKNISFIYFISFTMFYSIIDILLLFIFLILSLVFKNIILYNFIHFMWVYIITVIDMYFIIRLNIFIH